MEDQSKFFNVIIDRTNQKLNSFQAQIIVLESQLQMAVDERNEYKRYVEEMPSLQFNVEELINLKSKLAETVEQNRIILEEKEKYFYAVLEEKEKGFRAALQEKEGQGQSVISERERMLTESLEQNLAYIEKIKLLEDRAKDGLKFLQDQNETLLQEIKRLNIELAISRSK